MYKSIHQIDIESEELERLRSILLSTKTEQGLKKFQKNLNELAAKLGYVPSRPHSKPAMLKKINIYSKQNAFLRYIATEHAHIQLCIIFEDFIRRIVLKYYEEDVRRLKSQKETINNKQLIELLLDGQNIHRVLAEKIVDDLMYKSTGDWYRALNLIGMNIEPSRPIIELFLIRNCLIHNDKKASIPLCRASPRYRYRKNIHLTTEDFENFKSNVEPESRNYHPRLSNW